MKKVMVMVLAGMLLGASAVKAQDAQSQWVLDPQSSKMSFLLSSTLHDVTGSVGEYKGFLNLVHESHEMDGQGVFIVSSMVTGNGARDRKMRQMFDSDHFPEIIYQFDHTVIPDDLQGPTELRGHLTIRDVSHAHPIPVIVQKEEGKISISGETEISLKEFGLKPPGVMGVIKVRDIVTVKFELVYRQVFKADSKK